MATETMGAVKTAIAFSAEGEKKFQATIAKYPNLRASLLQVLHLAQEEFGYLSSEVLEYVGERLELPASKVLQVATFYTMYFKRPHGKYHIEVCTSVPCCMMGSYDVLRHLEKRLGVKPGEVTADKKFSYAEAECLAGCGHAPLMQVNSEYFEHLTPEKIDEILNSFK